MTHKNRSRARYVQKALSWKYMRALNFVNDNLGAAVDFADIEKISVKEALVQMAKAEIEVREDL